MAELSSKSGISRSGPFAACDRTVVAEGRVENFAAQLLASPIYTTVTPILLYGGDHVHINDAA